MLEFLSLTPFTFALITEYVSLLDDPLIVRTCTSSRACPWTHFKTVKIRSDEIEPCASFLIFHSVYDNLICQKWLYFYIVFIKSVNLHLCRHLCTNFFSEREICIWILLTATTRIITATTMSTMNQCNQR